ncbi:MAG: hypothetical protein HYS27_10585 [Deltaproteobacteria bacterium]|nr:hypothetical protein [Deltaproteobacteria bacterium]
MGTVEHHAGTLSKSEARIAAVAVVLAAAVLAAAVWSVPVWFGNDAPAHLFSAYASAHLGDPAKGFADYFVPNSPITTRGFLETYRLIDPFLPWQQAYRVTVIIIAELWAFAFLFAATALERRRWPVGLCGFVLALGWPLDLGFFSFWQATAGALVVVGLSIRFADRRWLPLALAPTLWATASAHVFAAMLAGAALLVIEAARRRGPQRWRALALVATAGVPAAVVAALSTSAREQHDPLTKVWGSLGERLGNILACTLAGPWWRALPLAALAVASIALLVRRRKQLIAHDAAIGGMGIVLLSLVAATPLHLRWMFFSPRFAPLGMSFVLLALPCERLHPRGRALLVVAVGVWLAVSCRWSSDVHRGYYERARPLLALVSTLEPAPARRLTVVLPVEPGGELGVRYVEPWRQLGQLVALELGGIGLYGLVGAPAIHPLLVRPGALEQMTAPPVAWLEHVDARPGPARRAQLTRILAASAELDELVLLGSDDDVAQALAAGYRARARAPGVVLARFAGCAGSVIVEGEPGSRVGVDVGWWPLRDPAQGYEGVIELSGSVTFEVDGLSCDEVWLRPPTGRCANADAEGYVRGRLAEGPLRCRIKGSPP